MGQYGTKSLSFTTKQCHKLSVEVCSLTSILEISNVEMCCKMETRECSENGLYIIKEECSHYMFVRTGYENSNRVKLLGSFTSNAMYYDDRQHRAQPTIAIFII